MSLEVGRLQSKWTNDSNTLRPLICLFREDADSTAVKTMQHGSQRKDKAIHWLCSIDALISHSVTAYKCEAGRTSLHSPCAFSEILIDAITDQLSVSITLLKEKS